MRQTALALLLVLAAGLCYPAELRIIPVPGVMNTNKIRLIREYSLRHYGTDTYELKDPRIIVIHYTQIATLSNTILYFLPDTFRYRGDWRSKFGNVNLGIHFLVDRDGTVYSFYPENVMARHIIGFNHCAIGIENIATNRADLTQAQLESNAWLAVYLARKYPSLEHLIGHHEYDRRDRPHFRHYLARDASYQMTQKPDPGPEFMKRLREWVARDAVAARLAD